MIKLRLPPEVYQAIKTKANEQGVSAAALIARLSTNYATYISYEEKLNADRRNIVKT